MPQYLAKYSLTVISTVCPSFEAFLTFIGKLEMPMKLKLKEEDMKEL